MTRTSLTLGGVAIAMACAALAACGAKTAHQSAAPEGVALVEFRRAVDAYATMQRQQLAGTAHLAGGQPGDITDAARQDLAERIRNARNGARPGDIFTPGVAVLLRHALDAEVRGGSATGTRAAIRDDAPGAFPLSVNMEFPAGPLPTMPGNVLAVLPTLPEGLDYRIVHTHLILRDTIANLVVDYLADVMCRAC